MEKFYDYTTQALVADGRPFLHSEYEFKEMVFLRLLRNRFALSNTVAKQEPRHTEGGC